MSGLVALAERAGPELLALGLSSLRVLPVAFLCPLLGGQLAPSPVRLAVALSLAIAVRPLAGPITEVSPFFWERCLREAALGLAMGLAAALPFDAARIGGRVVDLVRGTSAEAALPVAGHHESATADLLHQLVLALALASGALPLVIRALGRSFALVPLGAPALAHLPGAELARLAGVALATGLSVAGPVLALSWTTDAALGLITRAAPGIPLLEVAAPVRILGGATVLWLALGLAADRVLSAAVAAPSSWAASAGAGP